jgi:hypothetical protein
VAPRQTPQNNSDSLAEKQEAQACSTALSPHTTWAAVDTGAESERHSSAFSHTEPAAFSRASSERSNISIASSLCSAPLNSFMRPFPFFGSPASLIDRAFIYSRDLSRPPRRRAIKSPCRFIRLSPAVRRAPNRRARILWITLNVRTTGWVGKSGGNGARQQQ